MEWKGIKLPVGSKLFRVHTFNFFHNGINFELEVDEYSDGAFTGHGQQSTDQSYMVESVSGNNVKECLEALIRKIESRRAP